MCEISSGSRPLIRGRETAYNELASRLIFAHVRLETLETVFATLKLHKPALIHVGAGHYGPDGTTYEYHDWN